MGHPPSLEIDPDKRYTVWRKHPYSAGYSLERSYYGSYFLDEGKYYLDAPWDEWYVTEEGKDPAGGGMMRKSTRAKKCPPGEIERAGYNREGYTRKDGTRVKKTRVPPACIEDRGRPGETSRGAKGGKYEDEEPWITREGKLGGPGYAKKPAKERRKYLARCVKKFGYRSCLGSLMVVLRDTEISKSVRKVFEADKKWLMDKYGGPGSFGPQKKEMSVGQLKTKLLQ